MPTIPETTAPVASEAPAAPASAAPAKKTAAKKTSKKAAAKKATKKAAKKPSGEKKPRAKKDGLRKPQVRILKALSKKDGLTRSEIAEKAPVDVATCVEYIGSDDDATRKANDKKHFMSLVSLGFVKGVPGKPKKGANGEFSDNAGPTEYSITASGRKALEQANKAE